MSHAIIKNVHHANEGKIKTADQQIGDECIYRINKAIDNKYNARQINGENKYVYQGGTDDLAHLRRRSLLFNRK